MGIFLFVLKLQLDISFSISSQSTRKFIAVIGFLCCGLWVFLFASFFFFFFNGIPEKSISASVNARPVETGLPPCCLGEAIPESNDLELQISAK